MNSESTPDDGRAHRWLLGGLSAVAVVSVLLPSDSMSAQLGSGLPLVVLVLLLAVAWVGFGVARRGLSVKFGLVEASVAGLVLWHSLAAWLGRHDNPRPALNMLWQWIGLGLGFLLARQLLRTQRECRALMAIMLALCVVETSYSFWSQAVEMPATRRLFEQKQAAMDPLAAQQTLARLNSPEPLGSFALTNSLAGLLAPWLIVGLGVLWSAARMQPRSWRVTIPLLSGIGLVAACLYLTHSRTAQLATAVGVTMLCITGGGQRLPKRRVMLGFLAALLLVIGAAALLTTLPALAGARLSLLIRFEYWQAAWGIIREHPWLGCGPGNFRDAITSFMPPQANEVVADPHSFVFELWATAGTPALLAMLVGLGAFFHRVTRSTAAANPDGETAAASAGNEMAMAIGAGIGLGLAYLLGRFFEPLTIASYPDKVAVAGLLLGGALLALLWPWVLRGRIGALLPAIGAAVLLINLLSAGGISYSGVASTLWLLIALGLCLASPVRVPYRISYGGSVALLVAATALTVICEATALNPVTNAQMTLDEAEERASDPIARHELLVYAAANDPLDVRPRRQLALLMATNPERKDQADPLVSSMEYLHDLNAAVEQWLQLAPRSASDAKLAGDIYLRLTGSDSGKTNLIYGSFADNAYRRAVELHPNNALMRAHLAWTEFRFGDQAQAARDAAEALRLDALMRDPESRFSGGLLRIADPLRPDRRPDTTMQEILASPSARPHEKKP